jgi:hypothetical protein
MVPTMPAPPASRYPPNRPAATLSTDERVKRSEYARDNIAALARGQPLEMRGKEHEEFANEWAAWFRLKMSTADCDDPEALLPDGLARLQQIIDDRIAVALKEFRKDH